MHVIEAIATRWALRQARAHERDEDWPAAAAALRRAARRDGADAELWFRLGLALERSHEWEAAAEAYRAAVALNDRRAGWQFRLGRVLERLREWEAAAEAYRAAVALNDRRAGWHFRLGVVLDRMREWEAAAEAYRAAVARDAPGEAYERLAGASKRAGDAAGVRRATAAIVERNPDLTPAEHQLLAADPQRFAVRRRLLGFVAAHLDEIRAHVDGAGPVAPDAAPRVWVYWGQGMSDAPPLVRRCHAELLRHHDRGDVVVLDDRTVDDYVDVPGHARDRTRDDRTKFSDVLRVELLTRHGGVWLDATCLPRRNVLALLPELLPSGFFAPRYRHARISSWFMASEPNDTTVAALRWAQVLYWRHHERPIDYYLLHHLFEALVLLDPGVQACCESMPWLSATAPSRLARALLDPYDADRYRQLLDGAVVHKLTYKLPPHRDADDTMLAHLLRDVAVSTTAPDAATGRR